MITLNTGSPTIGLKKTTSVRIPKANPTAKVNNNAKRKGIPQL
jgi:hypothetical protein